MSPQQVGSSDGDGLGTSGGDTGGTHNSLKETGLTKDNQNPQRKQSTTRQRRQNLVPSGSHQATRSYMSSIPDEILVRIFFMLAGGNSRSNDISDVSPEIKAVRLVCWRFCNASSHLLLNEVTVKMNMESMQRLHSISCHPTIKLGIRKVKVLLQYYDSAVAASLPLFVAFASRTIEECHSQYVRRKLSPAAQLCLDKATQMLEACEYLSDETPHDETEATLFLEMAYKEYKKCYQAQDEARKDMLFVTVVAEACARMPLARSLKLFDQLEYEPQGYRVLPLYSINSSKTLLKELIKPLSFEEGHGRNLGAPPVEDLFMLGGVLQEQLGASLHSLELVTTPPPSYIPLALPENLYLLTQGSRDLQSFTFGAPDSLSADLRGLLPLDQLKALGNYLSAILDTSSLQKISLNLEFLWYTGILVEDLINHPQFSLGSILTFRPWFQLTDLILSGVPIRQVEVEDLVAQLSPNVNITFEQICLTEGIWAETVEVLRKVSSSSSIFCSPMGAECIDMTFEDHEMLVVDRRSKEWECNYTEAFIRRWTDENPWRKIGLAVIDVRTDTDFVEAVNTDDTGG